MVELPAVGPLEFPCSQSLDEFLGQKLKTKLGRCGELTCEQCGARELIIEVGATARVLEEDGGHAVVLSMHSIPKALPPEHLHAAVQPKLKEAIAQLQEKYIAGLEARWTLEQDVEGAANAHILIRGSSTPKIGTLRKTFDGYGLGREVNMEPVANPLAIAAYTSKIPLSVFVLPPKGQPIALDHGLRFNGGSFAQATSDFYRGEEGNEAFAEPFLEQVASWAAGWDKYWAKLPPGLTSDLADANVAFVGTCQSETQELTDAFYDGLLEDGL